MLSPMKQGAFLPRENMNRRKQACRVHACICSLALFIVVVSLGLSPRLFFIEAIININDECTYSSTKNEMKLSKGSGGVLNALLTGAYHCCRCTYHIPVQYQVPAWCVTPSYGGHHHRLKDCANMCIYMYMCTCMNKYTG